MASADIELLFGMLGEGDVNGASGSLIRGQLNQLVSALNNNRYVNERRIRVILDSPGTKQALRGQLNTVMNDLSATTSFKVKISQIEADGAISKLKDDINKALKMLRVDTGFDVKVNEDGSKSAVKQIAEDAETAIKKAERLKAVIEDFKESQKKAKSSYKKAMGILGGDTATGDDAKKVKEIRDNYINLNAEIGAIQEKQKNGLVVTDGEIESTRKLFQETQALTNAVIAEYEAKKKANAEAKAQAINDANIELGTEKYTASVKKLTTLLSDARKMEGWTKAKDGVSKDAYNNVVAYGERLEGLISKLNDGELSQEKFNKEVQEIEPALKNARNQMQSAGEATKTWADRLKDLATKFGSWLSVSQAIMFAIRQVKKMVSTVIELDTAMTELKKVTDETDATYTKFFVNATKRAKELGAALSDTITATADFARLGYSIDDASKLADAAIVYKNVGDGIESISDASESVISTMRAFGIEAEDVMLIVDKFNEIGNNFAISSKGVGDALLRSASALHAANNTLDESIAIITAANSVIQDPDVVGTAIKTISMYLRAAKTEAEQAGESTDGMANSVSELREELLRLTGGKVDIMLGDGQTFKSTYQILKELSAVWKDLSDITQANILEQIGGRFLPWRTVMCA